MISAKLVVLMATMAMIGVGLTGATPLAMAQQSSDGTDGGSIIILPDITWIIDRNNEIEQSIEQDQEACTNIAGTFIPGGGVLSQVQSNDCVAVQNQEATNNAAIEDNSVNIMPIIIDGDH
jgi:hypothetical protein